MIKILTVEDDVHLRETLVEQLSLEPEFDARGVSELGDAKVLINEFNPDIILLDVSLPDGDGRDLCRWIRAQGHTIPVLMLTGQDSETDTVGGLEAGANDYIAKPLRLRELVARIKVHLKQYQSRIDARITLGPFSFNPGNKTLTHKGNGKMLNLTEKETAIIRYLADKNGATVGKEELLENIWGYNSSMTTHTLETHIYRLRQKIGFVDEVEILITGRNGYKLSA